ncbi:MAG TPA: hypothetical protein VIU34_13180 [Steroidobacter sp.]
MRLLNVLCSALWLLTACASTERPASERPSLAGSWAFDVQTGTNVTHGSMVLSGEKQNYTGTLTTDQGNNVLPIRSLTLDGSRMDMTVESPNGLVTFKGTLSADTRTFLGTVTYYTGQSFPMSGTRRE